MYISIFLLVTFFQLFVIRNYNDFVQHYVSSVRFLPLLSMPWTVWIIFICNPCCRISYTDWYGSPKHVEQWDHCQFCQPLRQGPFSLEAADLPAAKLDSDEEEEDSGIVVLKPAAIRKTVEKQLAKKIKTRRVGGMGGYYIYAYRVLLLGETYFPLGLGGSKGGGNISPSIGFVVNLKKLRWHASSSLQP